MRKFISILSAAALASSVVVMPLSASAEDIYTYDGSNAAGVFAAGDSHLKITSETDDMGEYAQITTDGSSVYKTTMDLPAEAKLSDNYVIEYDVMIHQSNGMQRFARYNQVAFISADAAQDTRDFGPYAALYNAANGGGGNEASETGQGYTTGVASSVTSIYGMTSAQINATNDTALELNDDTTGIISDKWYRVQTAVSGTVSTVTVIDSEGNKVVDAVEYVNSATALDKVFVTVGRGDAAPTGPGVVSLDNIRIYAGAAETLETEGLRGEKAEEPTLPPAAEITETNVIDFDSATVEINNKSNSGRMNTSIGTVSDIGNDTQMGIFEAVNPEDNGNAGVADIDISQYTKGKAHVIVSYDFYMPDSGRFKVIASDAAVERTKPTEMNNGIYMVGKTGGSGMKDIVAGAWNTVTIDVNFETGDVQYNVKSGETTVALGTTTTEKKELTYLQFASWSAVTAYVDNITIQTGGEMEIEEPTGATPEPAATAEGSNINLVPEGARATLSSFEAAEDGVETVLNHTNAKKAKSTADNTTISAYSANARGNSIYVAYDVNVSKGAAISVTPYGDSGKAQASSLTLAGKADGTINITIPQNSSTTHTIKNDLVCGTWYRVVMEIQQNGTAETGTTAGALKYNVYRIDAEDQTKSTAAVEADGYARGLDKMGVTSVGVAVTGDVYIDNGVVYLAAQSSNGGGEEPTPGIATPEPAGTDEGSGIDLLPADAAKFADFSAAEGAAETMLNHENAKPAVDAASISIYDANANIRGKSVYAAYDVLVNAGDKLVMKAMNKTDLGTQFVLEGKDDGTVDVYAYVNKGDKVNIAGNLVCGTWYRVVIEIPQNNNDGATNTGDARYTIYRINPTDSTKTAGIAAQASGLTPRNLSGKAATDLVTEVTGTPYIDNGVTYLMTRSDNIWYRYHFTSVDGVKTVSSIEQIPADDLSKKSDKIGREYYIWNTYMQPYVPTTAEETTPEVTE